MSDSTIEKYISILIVVILLVIALIYIIKIGRKNIITGKLKTGKIKSTKIKGKITEIKYRRKWAENESGTFLENIQIIGRYFIVKAVATPTKDYKSQTLDYNGPHYKGSTKGKWSIKIGRKGETIKEEIEIFNTYVKKYINIGDEIEIMTSKKNNNDYYIPMGDKIAKKISEEDLLSEK